VVLVMVPVLFQATGDSALLRFPYH